MRKKNMKSLYLSIILMCVFISNAQSSKSICTEVKSNGEGHWPIPESDFTKSNAIKELNRLKELLNVKATYIEDIESKKHNAFVIFEGYILKKRITELKLNKQAQAEAINEFCKFLESKAYVSH